MGRKKLYIPIDDEFIEIKTTITKNQLIKILCDNFIPWTECYRKCGWAETCKYTKRLKNSRDDQQCCVVMKILENLINCTFDIYKKLNNSKKYRYLIAITKYTELLADLKGWLGMTYDERIVKWAGDYAPNMYGGLLRERRNMAEIASLLKKIKGFNTEIPVCLVEGHGDKRLLQTFVRYSRAANFDILKYVDIISGKTAIRKGRIDTLIKNKIRQGERTIVILDGDESKAKTMNSLKKLWEQKLVKQKDIYVFKHNIELAFPSDMLFQAVREYVNQFNLQVQIKQDQIIKIMADKGNFVEKCEKVFNINIKKVFFDGYLGFLLAREVEWKFSEIMQKNPPYNKHEIYQFLRVVAMRW